MCTTILGRIETRTFILIGPAILGAILSLLTGNEGFIVIIGIYLLQGVVLDVFFYPYVIKWQPPWLTFVLAIGEFIILYVIAQVAEVGLKPIDAVWWFWLSWTLAIWTKIVVLPNIFLTWIENGGEFRDVGWSVPAQNEPFSVVAAMPSGGGGVPQLAREFSSVNQVPPEIANLPSPSGVRRIPQGIR